MGGQDHLANCYGNLIMRIIEPAFTELREKVSLVIEWEARLRRKKGYWPSLQIPA
jgi:hypothetical protein